MYVEAEAKMDTYKAQDGSNKTSLNLLQRRLSIYQRPVDVQLTTEQATSKLSKGRGTGVPPQPLVLSRTPKTPRSLSAVLASLDMPASGHECFGVRQCAGVVS